MEEKVSEERTRRENRNETVERMLTEKVSTLILKNAVPTICSMMVTALYNTADTFFVSRLGTSASGAVGIIFSIMAIIQAFGFTIGMGSGSIVSRLLGGGDTKKASTYTSTAIILAFSLGTVLGTMGLIFQDGITRRLGATETILPYARAYAHYILIGTPFFMTSFVMNNLLRWQGKAALATVGLTTGGILNMVLDPLFIFGFKLGIKGAAIATLTSQFISFSILLSMFLRKKSVTDFSPAYISKNKSDYAAIFRTGFPSFCRQGIGSFAMIALNMQARKYGALSPISGFSADATIAAMAITNRLFMFLMSVALGLGQGFQPVCGMNFGAKKYDRVKEGFFFLVKITALILSVLALSVFIFAPQITRLFRDDPNVINTARLALRAQALIIPLHALIFGANTMLQTTGKPEQATFLSSLRQGLYFLPLILILPYFFGVRGVQTAQAIADTLTALTSVPFIISFFNHLDQNKSVHQNSTQ